MSRINNLYKKIIPSGFLWRITVLNILVIVSATAISGWALYNTACFLAAGVGNLDVHRQQQFNSVLRNYLWIFMITVAFLGSFLHYYFMKRLTKPIRSLIESTQQLRHGHYPELVKVYKQDEIGQLVTEYNGLITQLENNEQQRKKLVTDLSHEIRTPLTNLNGYLQALKDGDIVGSPELFGSLHQESSRLSQMINQFEQLKEWDYIAANSIVKKETHEITEVLTQSVAMFDKEWKQKNISIEQNIERCKISVNLDGMQQVINNLLDNAIRYNEGMDPILLTGEIQGDSYRISVTGHSTPIPEIEKDNIFRRFYRLDVSRSRLTGGSGLGLAISKEIVERHHQGEIGVETTDDSNTFWVLIPL